MQENESISIFFADHGAGGSAMNSPKHMLADERIDIGVGIRSIGGCPTRTDQNHLFDFMHGVPQVPKGNRLIHGERDGREALKIEIEALAEAKGHALAT